LAETRWLFVPGPLPFFGRRRSAKILAEASKRMGWTIEDDDTFFVLPREMIVEYTGSEMPIWQRKVFGALFPEYELCAGLFLHPMHTNRQL